MTQIDALTGLLHRNHGDELILAVDEPPTFFAQGQPIKLFLRPFSAARLTALVHEVLSEEERTALAQEGQVRAAIDGPDGRFDVHVRGAAGERVRLVRSSAPPTEPAAAPAAAPPPPAATPSHEPAPAIDGPPAALPEALSALLEHAAQVGASDLHLADQEPATLRYDGRLAPLDHSPRDVRALIWPALDPGERHALEAGRSVDRALQLPSGRRFRLHAYRCEAGWAAAIRVLPPSPPALESLGLPPLDGLVHEPHGLILVTGPTGSGKSTTAAALIREALRRRRGLLVTLEDPIEFRFEGGPGALVRQRQIGRHAPDFPAGLRDALREDPDLLLVGEMRDAESVQLALTAAEPGHLVFASLHARSAAHAVERVVDAVPPSRQALARAMLATSLRAVIAQRLLPRADGVGRVVAAEVLRGTPAVANLIREGKTAQLVSTMQTGASEGMVPLDRALRALVQRGVIDEATARAALS